MSVVISGALTDGAGIPMSGCQIILKSRVNTSEVVMRTRADVVTGSNTVSWTFRSPSGHGLSGISISDTGRNSADNVNGVYYRPLQKLINGTWYNVASI
ncbi:tail fiber protein [Shigella sonnei]|nr:tail fiber protein [Shigella sonnei]